MVKSPACGPVSAVASDPPNSPTVNTDPASPVLLIITVVVTGTSSVARGDVSQAPPHGTGWATASGAGSTTQVAVLLVIPGPVWVDEIVEVVFGYTPAASTSTSTASPQVCPGKS